MARAARDQDVVAPHGASQRKYAGAGRVSRGASEGDARVLPGTPNASAARSGTPADARVRWSDRLRARLAGAGAHAAQQRPADVAGRKPGGRRNADLPSRVDDARVGAAGAAPSDRPD